MAIYRDAKRRGIYPPLFTDPERDSCIFNNQTTSPSFLRADSQRGAAIFLSVRKTIYQVAGANQNARKLLSTDLVNTKCAYVRVTGHRNPRRTPKLRHVSSKPCVGVCVSLAHLSLNKIIYWTLFNDMLQLKFLDDLPAWDNSLNKINKLACISSGCIVEIHTI